MQALNSIKIIDFTRLLPGPLATHLLAQMGAEVIKIESPKRMDYVRASGAQVDGASVLFHQLNHNKTSKIIDYASEEGKVELLELLKDADAIIEQFRPGAMEAWGFGYEAIKAINPSIVYVSLTGYGQSGNYAQEAGHDFNYLAYAGIMSMLKDDAGKPTVSGVQFADIGGAYMAVMALQTALLKKLLTGEGSFVDVALCDAMLPFLAVPYALHKGGLNHKQFNILDGKTIVNYAAYECADGKWLSVAAMEVKFWNNLCDAIERSDWKRDNPMQLFVQMFPKAEVETLFLQQTQAEWMAIFKGKDVCVAPILELDELEQHPYHQEKQNFETITTPNGEELSTVALPFSIS